MDGSMKKIWGWDPVNKTWVKCIVNEDGKLQIDGLDDLLKASDLNIDVSGDLQVDVKSQTDKERQLLGYDGSAWQKLPLIFGYTDVWSEYITGAGTGATLLKNTTVVAPGYINVLTFTSLRHNASVSQKIYLSIIDAENNDLYFYYYYSLSPNVLLLINYTIILVESERLRLQILNFENGKTAYWSIRGYKMKIS